MALGRKAKDRWKKGGRDEEIQRNAHRMEKEIEKESRKSHTETEWKKNNVRPWRPNGFFYVMDLHNADIWTSVIENAIPFTTSTQYFTYRNQLQLLNTDSLIHAASHASLYLNCFMMSISLNVYINNLLNTHISFWAQFYWQLKIAYIYKL